MIWGRYRGEGYTGSAASHQTSPDSKSRPGGPCHLGAQLLPGPQRLLASRQSQKAQVLLLLRQVSYPGEKRRSCLGYGGKVGPYLSVPLPHEIDQVGNPKGRGGVGSVCARASARASCRLGRRFTFPKPILYFAFREAPYSSKIVPQPSSTTSPRA
jgi:hypothetical protein